MTDREQILEEAVNPDKNVERQLEQVEAARTEAESGELLRFPDGRLWPDLVACPACGETTAIPDQYQERRYPAPSCGNCGKRFSGPYRMQLIDEAMLKAAIEKAKGPSSSGPTEADWGPAISMACPDCRALNLVSPEAVDPACQSCGCPLFPPKGYLREKSSEPLDYKELYEAADKGRSAEWVASLVRGHAISEPELFVICEMAAYLADQGVGATISAAYLREKLEVLVSYRRRALPNAHHRRSWDDAAKLAIPLRVGDYVTVDREVWNIKSIDKRVELNEWDRLDIEAVRPYREGRNIT